MDISVGSGRITRVNRFQRKIKKLYKDNNVIVSQEDLLNYYTEEYRKILD